MFLMFELMAMMFVLLFSSTANATREIERFDQEQRKIQTLEREIREIDEALEYLEEMQNSTKVSEK